MQQGEKADVPERCFMARVGVDNELHLAYRQFDSEWIRRAATGNKNNS